MWCLCVCGVSVWCLCMVSVCGVCVWSLYVVSMCGVFVRCLCVRCVSMRIIIIDNNAFDVSYKSTRECMNIILMKLLHCPLHPGLHQRGGQIQGEEGPVYGAGGGEEDIVVRYWLLAAFLRTGGCTE